MHRTPVRPRVPLRADATPEEKDKKLTSPVKRVPEMFKRDRIEGAKGQRPAGRDSEDDDVEFVPSPSPKEEDNSPPATSQEKKKMFRTPSKDLWKACEPTKSEEQAIWRESGDSSSRYMELLSAKRKEKRAKAGYVTPPSDIESPGRTEVTKNRAKEIERTSLTPTSPRAAYQTTQDGEHRKSSIITPKIPAETEELQAENTKNWT
ncbi:hypothetical protein K1T71_005347 [Dendrolimus kikuchii]|uniref:Uncharacterized protein n=1 Tax=Dendrolimus kikuchii TaxID=765133 RepID=A0ACC1D4X7_9NEOP|nr:hypothetical protein K1T71_005347 [Dendrolimus kikuchii]